MIIRILQFTLLMLFSIKIYAYGVPSSSTPSIEKYYKSLVDCRADFEVRLTNCLAEGKQCFNRFVRANGSQCDSGTGQTLYYDCNDGFISDTGTTCHVCPAGTTRIGTTTYCENGISDCPDGATPDPVTQACPVVCPEAGEPAGIDEGADGPPGYATKCLGECSIIGYEYFQRTDNDLWVIAYIYTGTECGDGDPLAEPDLPPGTPGPDPVTPDVAPDTDGDGIPDNNDDDIDGDGIPNSQDTDQDGDGVDDVDDPTPQGGADSGNDPSQASTSNNCQQHPTCSGDAIQCAQLLEIWRLRCKTVPANTEEISDNLDDDIIGASVDDGEQALQNASDEIIDALDDDSGMSLSTDLQNPITALFNGVTCSDIGFEFKDTSFNISCSETQLMRDVMAFILYVTTIVYLYQLARKPVEN